MTKNEKSIERINHMISIPEKLYTLDGREILIMKWSPCAEIDQPYYISIDGIIQEVKDEDLPMQEKDPYLQTR